MRGLIVLTWEVKRGCIIFRAFGVIDAKPSGDCGSFASPAQTHVPSHSTCRSVMLRPHRPATRSPCHVEAQGGISTCHLYELHDGQLLWPGFLVDVARAVPATRAAIAAVCWFALMQRPVEFGRRYPASACIVEGP